MKVTESDNLENSPRSRATLAWDVNGSQQRLRSIYRETFSGKLTELSFLATCSKRGHCKFLHTFAILFCRHSEKLFPLLSTAPHFKRCLTAGPGPHNEMHCLTSQVPSCVQFCSPQANDWRVTQIYNCHVPCAWVITRQLQCPTFPVTKWFRLDFQSLSHRVLRAETVIVWLPGSGDSRRY